MHSSPKKGVKITTKRECLKALDVLGIPLGKGPPKKIMKDNFPCYKQKKKGEFGGYANGKNGNLAR